MSRREVLVKDVLNLLQIMSEKQIISLSLLKMSLKGQTSGLISDKLLTMVPDNLKYTVEIKVLFE